jgi:hypothetical protein
LRRQPRQQAAGAEMRPEVEMKLEPEAAQLELVGVAPVIFGSAIEDYRQQFVETGDGGVLLDAVDLCARSGVALPKWAADAFSERYSDWRQFRQRTLDEAFKAERRGVRMSDQAALFWLRPRIFKRVLELRAKGLPFDGGMFEAIGEELGVSESTVRNVLYTDPEGVKWRTAQKF